MGRVSAPASHDLSHATTQTIRSWMTSVVQSKLLVLPRWTLYHKSQAFVHAFYCAELAISCLVKLKFSCFSPGQWSTLREDAKQDPDEASQNPAASLRSGWSDFPMFAEEGVEDGVAPTRPA